uniref:Uncharacterized protein n=1 Tax=Strigops habroptila TaxID=2489341 RepID=A0A672U936_STRHB
MQRVTTWLKKVFGNQPIPQYEVNEQTVDILCKLAEYNEARDTDVSLVIEGLKEWSKEYKAEGEFQAPVLSSIKVILSNPEDCLNLASMHIYIYIYTHN